MHRISHQRTLLALFALSLLCGGTRGAPGDLLLDYLPFSTIAPQDLAFDPVDDCFWVTAFLDDKIYKLSSDMRSEISTIPSPFVEFEFQTGIAYNSIDDTLLVTNVSSGRVVEIDKSGVATGREIMIPFDPEEPTGRVTVRSLTFDPGGDAGNGSLYVVEALGTGIYELTLAGDRVRVLAHPEDPDGFPGEGRHASAAGLDVTRDEDGEITGFWITGVRDAENRLLLLDVDGSYTGRHVSLNAAGGTVSSILRHPFPSQAGGEPLDAWICVVESNARFAVLEFGEPDFREIFDLDCNVDDRHASLTWESRQSYDEIEIVRDCETIATLAGDATSWESDIEIDGVYRLGVRARSGDQTSEIGPCEIVVGAGQLLRSRTTGGSFPADLVIDESFRIIVTDALDRQLLVFDGDDFGDGGPGEGDEPEPLSIVPLDETFVVEDEFVTGISRGPAPGDLFVYNTTAHVIGLTDLTGEVLETVEAKLPNIDEDYDPEDPESEPDFGAVYGMTFDPNADGGAGNFLVVEVVRDVIYRLDRDGNVISSIENPFRSIERPTVEDVYSTYTSGISLVPGRSDLLRVTGGTYRDFRQKWIALIDAESGEVVPGSLIPTDALRTATGAGSFTIENVADGGRSRLFALAIARSRSVIAEIVHDPPAAPTPSYLSCRQISHANDVELSFTNNGPYSRLEIFRDCEMIATSKGDATTFVDVDVPAGDHDYAVRGVTDEMPGDLASCGLRVGLGAVLQRALSWPARSPQQLTRDPIDGSYYAAVNWIGDERKVYRFDRNFRFISERESSVDPTRQIATLSVRATSPNRRLLYYIDWLQPVPLGAVDSQQFFLIAETLDGERVSETEIFPPRPTNGFITFPAGLTWDAESDTFFYLERNSKTILRMLPDGTELDRFQHPSPPFQNFVFNLGLTVHPQRRTLLFTSARDFDHGITIVREMDFSGALTGFEIPLVGAGNEVRDIELVHDELITAGSGSFSELLRLKATADTRGPFVRGDVDDSGSINLSDAVALLEHLFRGGTAPACADAADADDTGSLSITDAVAILHHLFQGAAGFPAPYPAAGQDPTPDGLGCR